MKRGIERNLFHNLFVEYLIVIDKSVYNYFLSLYENLGLPLIINYIQIFFCQVVNGVIYMKKFFFLISVQTLKL
jgi:hypothetical protein